MSNSIFVPKGALCHKISHLVAGFYAFWPPFAIMFSHIFKTKFQKASSFKFYFRHFKVNSPLYEAFPSYNQIKENNGQMC
jgi:hypothetical protein